MSTEDLYVVGPAVKQCSIRRLAGDVGRHAAADHVNIDLRHDRITRHRGIVGEVLRSPKAALAASVPDEENRPLRFDLPLHQRLSNLEQ